MNEERRERERLKYDDTLLLCGGGVLLHNK